MLSALHDGGIKGQVLNEHKGTGGAQEDRCLAPFPFVSGDQTRHYSDLLYEIKLNGGGQGLVYFLFEHKSFHDRFTALQVLRYMVEIWESGTRGQVLYATLSGVSNISGQKSRLLKIIQHISF